MKTQKVNLLDKHSVKSAIKKVKRLKDKLENFDSFLGQLNNDLRRYHLTPLLRDLRYYPPKNDGKEPIKFTSEKQRRYVMWKLNGKPHTRTGKLWRSWYVTILPTKNGLRIKVIQRAKWSKYVYGDFANKHSIELRRRYMKPQQNFLRKIGWQFAYDRIYIEHKLIEKRANEMFQDWINTP